jgi:hypothetical protein
MLTSQQCGQRLAKSIEILKHMHASLIQAFAGLMPLRNQDAGDPQRFRNFHVMQRITDHDNRSLRMLKTFH